VARCRDDGASDCPDLTLGRRSGSGHDPEELAGDVAFQAAHDLLGRTAFCAAPGDVGAGRGIDAHPDQDDSVECAVEAPVASAVEPVPDGVP